MLFGKRPRVRLKLWMRQDPSCCCSLLNVFYYLFSASSLCCIGPAEGKDWREWVCEIARVRRGWINNIPTYCTPSSCCVKPYLFGLSPRLLQWCMSDVDLDHVTSKSVTLCPWKQRVKITANSETWLVWKNVAAAAVDHTQMCQCGVFSL